MQLIFIRFTLLLFLLLLLTLSGCRDDNTVSPTRIQGLPHKFHFSADAQGTDNQGQTANCTLDLIFEIRSETSRDTNFVAYNGTHGGEVFRRISDRHGTGFEFSAVVFGEVKYGLYLQSGIINLDIPINLTAKGRFWRALAHFEGVMDANGTGSGAWTCAPLDIDEGAYKDSSLVAQGLWNFQPVNLTE